jgi:hypothetical protein
VNPDDFEGRFHRSSTPQQVPAIRDRSIGGEDKNEDVPHARAFGLVSELTSG